MKKLAFVPVITLILGLFTGFPSEVTASDLTISAKSAIIIEAKTGQVIFAKNASERRPIASITKIMTTLLCLESGNLNEPFVVDPAAVKVEGSSMGLLEGDTVTKTALCYGMLLPSGNDAANVVAMSLGGTVAHFAQMMNERAGALGMNDSHFVTPSGLHEKEHYSTASDMALLAREALSNPDFAAICRQQNAKLSYGNPPYDRWLKNSNKLLGMYSGCIGMKTGFTDEAGRCLVSAAERNGVTLICVSLKAPNDWDDHTKMLDYGFAAVKDTALTLPVDALSIGLVGGFVDSVALVGESAPTLPMLDGNAEKITSAVILPRFLYAPVKSGETVGRVDYFFDGKKVLEIPLVTKDSAKIYTTAPKRTLFGQLKNFLYKINKS